ncbi:hypothetical protein HMPREF1429_00322 [Helicobacter pylori GAM93Bi]|nr:hypothetical protein HMPREF1429_00322 [Helicobacter pylori GAM93Bi]
MVVSIGYDLTCAGLTPNLLADNLWSYGLRDEDYDDEGNVIEPENENEDETQNTTFKEGE